MIHTVAAPELRVRLLGPVAVAAAGGWLPVNGRRRSAVLAGLALQPRETVSADRLVDIVWGDRAPRTAGDTLRNHVSYLRGILPAGAAIVTRSAGYAIDLQPRGTDVEAAERLIAQATRGTDAHERESNLSAAIALWQGPPLADLTELTWFGEHAQRLDRLLLDARRLHIETRLELGEHQQLVAELENLTREHRLDEQLHAQLMLAQSRAGRQADALATYQRLRDALDGELGVLPGPALRDNYAAILRQDTAVAPPPTATGPKSPASPVPAQLPPAIVTFVGRDLEAASLQGILAHTPEGTGPIVIAICGTAGVGKTALAVSWAHRVTSHFPDGQLYVDLRGFDPGGAVMDPAEAVRAFLDALDVPQYRIPASPDAQVSLYRSLLANRRMLIVGDNARDEQQVRPLLPGAPGCLVVVTSRHQLSGLVVADGAHPLTLDRPSMAEARLILARRLGDQRIADEPAAVDAIITHCARLPLALAVAAAPAALAPTLPLAQLASQLGAAATTLDSFDGADPATNIRAVFSWSYIALSDPAARLFRLLGLCPGPEISLTAAASAAGLSVRETQPLVAELVRAHLLTATRPGRFGFHDLLRAYAIDQANQYDSDEQRATARHRFLDHHLHTARTATLLLKPGRDPIHLDPPAPGVTPEPLTTCDAAVTWFAVERPVLIATVTRPADGFDQHTWQLAWALHNFLTTRGDGRDNELVQRTGLHAAERLRDPAGQAYAGRCLGDACLRLGRLTEAEHHLRAALRLFEQTGNRVAMTDTHLTLSVIAVHRGDIHEALSLAERVHQFSQSVGYPAAQAYAANNIGWCHGRLGNHHRGLSYCQEALDILTEIGDLDATANTWDSLGNLHFGVGDPVRGEHCYRQAIALFRTRGEQFHEAEAHVNLGDCLDQNGMRDAARQAWQQALAIVEDLEPDAAAPIRARLESVGLQA